MTPEQTQQIETLVNQQFQSLANGYKKSMADLEAMLSRERNARLYAENENKALKADILHLQSKRENARLNVMGTAEMGIPVKLTQQEAAALLPAKLAASSLEDIVLYDAISRGINPKNKAEFDAFLGVEEGD